MRILLIEDDAIFRKVCTAKLEHEGYEVLSVNNGKKAMTLMEEKKPDLILLDVILPKMDGFELLQAKIKDKGLTKIPVIMLTSLGQDEDQARAKKLGAIDYFVKLSLDFPSLIKKIQQVLPTEGKKQSAPSAMDMSVYRDMFMRDAKKVLTEGEKALAELEKDPSDMEALFEVMRMFHSLKGTSLLMGYKDFASLCAAQEAPLKKLWEEKKTVTSKEVTHARKTWKEIEAMLTTL